MALNHTIAGKNWTMLADATNISDSAAYRAGYVAGGIIFTLLLLLLAIKCFSIARRPATHTLCAVSLGVLLGAYFLCSVLVAAARGVPQEIATLLVILSGLLLLGAIMAAVTLAIIGLVDYARNKTLYHQGRAQAVTALVLSGVLVLGVMVAVLARAVTANRRFTVAADQPRADEWLKFADLNFRFQTPGRPWVQLDAKKLSENTMLALTRNFPSVSFAIVAENLGNDTQLNDAQVVELSKANLRLAVKSVNFLQESPLQLHNLHGTQIEFETQSAQFDIFYKRWIVFTNGYAYYMTAWGRLDQAAEVRTQAAELFSRFALIDPNRIAPGNTSAVKNFKSARYGYEMNLEGSGWFPSPTLSHTVPVADFGVVNSRSAGFYVIPVQLGGRKPRIEALAAGLLALVKINYPGDETAPPKKIQNGGLTGLQLDCERDEGTGRREYRTQILQGNDMAYLFVSWKLVKDRPDNEDLDEPFHRLQFSQPDLTALSASSPRKTEKERQGFVFNETGLFFYHAKQYDQSIVYFSAALEWLDDSGVYLENLVQAYDTQGKSTEALACLEAHAPLVAQNPGLRAEQAHLQEQAGQADRALTNYASVFATGYINDDHFADYLRLLGQSRERANVLAEVQKYLKHRDSPAIRLLEAGVYKQDGEFSRAIDLLKSQREKFPFNLELTTSLADAYYLAGLYKESIDLCDQAAVSGADSAYLYYLKGRSEYGLKRYREAKTSFESALKKAPASNEIKQFLDHVSAMLGEGSNSSLKETIAPVPIPARLTNAPLAAAPAGYDKDYGAEYLRQITAVSYEKDKELKRTEYMRVKVLDAAGVSKFSTIQFTFDPLSEQIFVNDLRVIDAAGKTVSTGSVSDYYLVDDTQTQLADQKKILNIPVSGLQPGHTIDLTVTRRDLAPPKTFRFYSRVFCSTSPARQDVLFLRGDTGSVKFQSTLAAAPQKDADGICWIQENSPIYRWEPYQQPASEFLPTVSIGDASATWEGEVRDYLEAIGDRLQLGADQRELARRLVQNTTNETERIRTLAAYVQTNYTYKAIEFGRRARIPQKTGEIVRNRYGDCKDHALLLQQMLEATGTPARLALVNPGSPVIESLPSLDQFTHMIVYLPQYEHGFFIDCTYKDAAPAFAAPMGLAGRKALILDPQHPGLAAVPDYPADSSSVHSARELRLTNQTDVLVHETLIFRGYYAGFMRGYLEKLQPPSRRDFLNEQMNHPGLEITHLEIKNLEDTSAPLLFEMNYLVKKQFQTLGNQIIGQLPDIWEHHYLWTDPAENRLTAFQLAFPLSLESTVTVEAPEGYGTPAAEGFEQDLHQPFATGRTTAQNQGSRMIINYSLHRPSGTFAPTEYATFRKSMDQALVPLEQNMAFSKISR